MSSETHKLFVKAFLKYLRKQILDNNSPEMAESLEVAVQCLEAAYEIPDDESMVTDAMQEIDLFNLFENACLNLTPEKKEAAEDIKNEGNRLMKEGKYSEALQNYNRAICLDATNPVFYCNRAAAYIRLNEFEKAIADCKMSLLYNPNYSKAHGRMGIAYSNLHKYQEAREAYKKALELEPDNQDYKNNLSIAEQRLEIGGDQNLKRILQSINPELQNLILDAMNDPVFSMASRQLVNQCPDLITGFREQLLNYTGEGNDGAGSPFWTQLLGNLRTSTNPGVNNPSSSEQSRIRNNETPEGSSLSANNDRNPQRDLEVNMDELFRAHEREGLLADNRALNQRAPVEEIQGNVGQMSGVVGSFSRQGESPPADGPELDLGGDALLDPPSSPGAGRLHGDGAGDRNI